MYLTVRVYIAIAQVAIVRFDPPPPLSSASVCHVCFRLEGDGIRSRHLRVSPSCVSQNLLTYTKATDVAGDPPDICYSGGYQENDAETWSSKSKLSIKIGPHAQSVRACVLGGCKPERGLVQNFGLGMEEAPPPPSARTRASGPIKKAKRQPVSKLQRLPATEGFAKDAQPSKQGATSTASKQRQIVETGQISRRAKTPSKAKPAPGVKAAPTGSPTLGVTASSTAPAPAAAESMISDAEDEQQVTSNPVIELHPGSHPMIGAFYERLSTVSDLATWLKQ